MTHSKPVIIGLSGTSLTPDEKHCLQHENPLGVILFARNIDNIEQIKSLVSDIKNTLGFNAPIFIDQEGGRVRRLRPPLVRNYPALQTFGDIWKSNPDIAKKSNLLEPLFDGIRFI